MREAWDDERTPAHPDPLAEPEDGSTHEQLFQVIDGPSGLEDADYDRMAEALTVLLQWCMAEGLQHPRRIAMRLIALTWVLSPRYFEGSPSLAQVARRLRLNPRYGLSKLTSEASRRFGIRNRAQVARAWNFREAGK